MGRQRRDKRARAKSRASSPREASTATPPKSDVSINRLGLIVAVVGLAGLFGLVLFLGEPPPGTGARSPGARAPDDEPEVPPVEQWQSASLREIPVDPSRDFIRGPVEAPVTIVEFTDFECPFCEIAHGYIQEVLGRYPEEVRLVFKNFPLDQACNSDMVQQLHPLACQAAVMARCAGARDPALFWRFHDAVFDGDGLDDARLRAKAGELGVRDEAFDACVSGRKEFNEVRADVELALSLGVDSTPSFFINGRAAPSYEIPALVEIIDHILESS